MRKEELSSLSLAFLGDAVYSQMVREYLVLKDDYSLKKLTELSVKYVSAKAQAALMKELLADSFLTSEEEQVYRRGRNSHPHSQAKNADTVTYRVATGFESLIGYLYLNDKQARIAQLWDYIKTKTGD